MKAKDLIELLKKLPGDTEIVVPGQEGGYNSFLQIYPNKVFLRNFFVQEYCGDHQLVSNVFDDPAHKDRFRGAIIISKKQFKTHKV